ncbi:MAG: gamma-glutamyltransferase family protein, partial [Pseudomonadota bacterium]
MSITQNDGQAYPYPSRRTATYAKTGMVATSQPLAAEAGLSILKAGGNAVDAAVATAAAAVVVEPCCNGLGGDAFALVWMKDALHGLNASSFAPAALTPDLIKAMGHHNNMPVHGWLPVTVPGIPSAWATLHKRWGQLSFTEVLAPAIRLAEQGFPVSPTISGLWQQGAKQMDRVLSAATIDPQIKKNWFDTFTINGQAPKAGQLFSMPDHAKSLKSIAATHAESFYRGELAHQIAAFSQTTGGVLTLDDLARYHAEWVEPISVHYRGYDIWQMPPNGQGLVVLMALNILKQYQFDKRDSIDTLHKQIEAMKLAFIDGKAFITQSDCMPYTVDELLAETYADSRRRLIGEQALQPLPGAPPKGGTVYLAAADSKGNMVSYIQSNYNGFGSGVVIPGTGIAMQNRGADFSLNAEHPNYLQPNKKTFHTIIPGFITKGASALGALGVMGEYMQPQGQVQVLTNMIDFGMNPQAALDAPRWQWLGDKAVGLEPEFGSEII